MTLRRTAAAVTAAAAAAIPSVVALPDGGARWFYEATRADGAHELRTVLISG